jgi:hypothetical protein
MNVFVEAMKVVLEEYNRMSEINIEVAQKVVSTYVYHFIDIGLSFIYQ